MRIAHTLAATARALGQRLRSEERKNATASRRAVRRLASTIAAIVLGAGASGLASDHSNPVSTDGSSGVEGAWLPPPREIERSQELDGRRYAVIAPLYVTPPFLSYIRLINAGDTAAAFSISVVGSGTAASYGTATYLVPTAATLQLSMSSILVDANAASRQAADSQFSFYIQSPAPLAGYQHVTLNEAAGYFGNASVCKYKLQEVQRELASQVMLPSVHTSRLAAAGYPAQIELHNFANAPITYRFYVRDETTGILLNPAGIDFPTRANASYVIPWSQIEQQIGLVPTESQLRVNLVVVDAAGAPPHILLGQTIVNATLSTAINMTGACAVNKPPANGDGGGLPIGGGGIRY